MATDRGKIPGPAVTLNLDDGRVEITVVDNEIWLSDYASGEKHNFTLVVPRKRLQGNKAAQEAVHQHFSKRGAAAPSARIAAAAPKLVEGPPAMAGYWYQDPNFPAHGGPVVIVEE
jgi:hypothetical protein